MKTCSGVVAEQAHTVSAPVNGTSIKLLAGKTAGQTIALTAQTLAMKDQTAAIRAQTEASGELREGVKDLHEQVKELRQVPARGRG